MHTTIEVLILHCHRPRTRRVVADRHTFTYMEHALQTDIKRLKFGSAATWNYASVTLVTTELSHNALTYVWLMAITQQKIRGSHMSAKETYILQHVHFHILVCTMCPNSLLPYTTKYTLKSKAIWSHIHIKLQYC
jgi:hypothetical protein